jgi:hypothetical protein
LQESQRVKERLCEKLQADPPNSRAMVFRVNLSALSLCQILRDNVLILSWDLQVYLAKRKEPILVILMSVPEGSFIMGYSEPAQTRCSSERHMRLVSAHTCNGGGNSREEKFSEAAGRVGRERRHRSRRPDRNCIRAKLRTSQLIPCVAPKKIELSCSRRSRIRTTMRSNSSTSSLPNSTRDW